MERMNGSEKSIPVENLHKENFSLTIARAISNVSEAKDQLLGKGREHLEGLEQNFRGMYSWIENHAKPLTNAARAGLIVSMVGQLASGCAPRTVSAEDMLNLKPAATEQYTPPDFVSTLPSVVEPTKQPTPEPTRFPDGSFYPQAEAFYQRDLGKIKDVGVLSPDKPFLTDARVAVEKELGITADQYGLYGFSIDGEKNDDSFVYAVDYSGENWKFYAIYKKDSDGFYKSIETDGEFAVLPMIQGKNIDGKASWGFDIAGGMLAPIITLDTATNSVFYTDPVTGEEAKVTNEVAIKVMADLKDRFQPINISVGDTVSSELVGREGLTEEMVGTEVVEEEGLPFKFLQNSEGKRIAVFMDSEWGKYLDVKIPNLLETKDAKESDVIRLTPEQVLDGTWANTITVETYRLGLDKQHIDPKYASYSINDHPEDEWSRSSLGFNYQELPPNIFEEIQNNKKLRPTLELYYAILHYPDGKEQILISSKFLQKDVVRPFNFFNMALYGSGNKLSNKSFVDNVIKTNFLTHNATPAVSIDKNETHIWNRIVSSGYYSNLWNLGYYEDHGSDSIAQRELEKLERDGFASKEINRIIFLQGGLQDIFDNPGS